MEGDVPPAVNQVRPEAGSKSFYAKLLFLFFFLSLPFVNPVVHGDGVGYYAYARAPLIQNDLHFEEDWRRANLNFAQSRILPGGQVLPDQYTETGRIANLFTVGPALLWSPFLLLAHGGVLAANAFGAHITADGFSGAYLVAMALATSLYGFLGLFLSYSVACVFLRPSWAFLATLGIWTASSLPVYMYFNPSWSHAHSAFAVTLFLWYWIRTRPDRTLPQWLLLGLCGGLLLDVYLPNGVFLLIPLLESTLSYRTYLQGRDKQAFWRLFSANAVFLLALVVALLPFLITRRIIFGGFFRFGTYGVLAWDFTAPHWRSVLFASEHGLLTWTPLLAVSLVGLLVPPRGARPLAAYAGISALTFYYLISSYPYWDGMASFGNRFFISLTPVFVLGLSFFLQRMEGLFRAPRRAFAAFALLLAVFALWNAGFIFQWGIHLVPARGPISWSEMVHNQFLVVPRRLGQDLSAYFRRRGDLMRRIEQKDIEQLKSAPSAPH